MLIRWRKRGRASNGVWIHAAACRSLSIKTQTPLYYTASNSPSLPRWHQLALSSSNVRKRSANTDTGRKMKNAMSAQADATTLNNACRKATIMCLRSMFQRRLEKSIRRQERHLNWNLRCRTTRTSPQSSALHLSDAQRLHPDQLSVPVLTTARAPAPATITAGALALTTVRDPDRTTVQALDQTTSNLHNHPDLRLEPLSRNTWRHSAVRHPTLAKKATTILTGAQTAAVMTNTMTEVGHKAHAPKPVASYETLRNRNNKL